MTLDAWLKANENIRMLIEDAIESLAQPEVATPLRTYFRYSDVSKILLKGLELLAEIHPVTQGQLPSARTYNLPLKLRLFQWSVRLLRS